MFFDRIGLPYVQDSEVDGFLFHVCIQKGVLIFDPRVDSGDLLHEAGHLAILPPACRSNFSGNIDNYLEVLNFDADERLLYCNDQAAIAWSYFAAKEIGLNPNVIIGVGMDRSTIQVLNIGCESTIGSFYSCQLYYLGILATKKGTVQKWLLD